jgi:hypothetical protein
VPIGKPLTARGVLGSGSLQRVADRRSKGETAALSGGLENLHDPGRELLGSGSWARMPACMS